MVKPLTSDINVWKWLTIIFFLLTFICGLFFLLFRYFDSHCDWGCDGVDHRASAYCLQPKAYPTPPSLELLFSDWRNRLLLARSDLLFFVL